MKIDFLAQPDTQLGELITSALQGIPNPNSVILVSAFASLQAVLRLKTRLVTLKNAGATVRIVVGVDMGGTSKEVLKELASWPVDVFVFKNKKSGVTFHPKLYIVESSANARVFLGSNNLTDGGLYGNYEGAVCVHYELPEDAVLFNQAKQQLKRFIDPSGPIGQRLDGPLLARLIQRREIPDEAEARRRRRVARGDGAAMSPEVASVFGFESTRGAPALPMEVKNVVIAAVQQQLSEIAENKRNEGTKAKAKKKSSAGASSEDVITPAGVATSMREFEPLAQISPNAFYLELTTTRGKAGNIPGEQRIPLAALHVAHDFWGWPTSYEESVNPRKGMEAGGERRVYWTRKPNWRVYVVGDPSKDVIAPVRMYFVDANSDFRFHTGNLTRWAKAGDLVRIMPVEEESYSYECALAVAGTTEHAAWKTLCAPATGRSPRVFGYS